MKVPALYQQVGGIILVSFDRVFYDAVAGDPFRYQLNEHSTSESVKISLGVVLRREFDNDLMPSSVWAPDPASSNSPPP